MRRRQVLALSSVALIGTAGCVGGDDDSTPDRDETAVSPGTPLSSVEPITTTVGSYELTLESVQRGVVTYTYPDAISVVDTDRRFVLFSVGVGDVADPPRPADFELQYNGEVFAPRSIERPSTLYRLDGSFYTSDDPGGRLLFALPVEGRGPHSRLSWSDRNWHIPDPIRRRLRAAPDFSVSLDEEPTDGYLTLTATNEGDRPQRFLLAVNQSGPKYAPIGVRTAVIDAGRTATFDVSVPSRVAVGTDSTVTPTARLTFDWVGGDAEREVSLG